MGLHPDYLPIFSPIKKETELQAMGPSVGEGHYGSASYFQSLTNPLNELFEREYHAYFGEKKAISSVMFNTYLGTKILIDAIIAQNSLDHEKILHYISGKQMSTACGTLRIDSKKRHLSRPVKIGKALSNGQFEIVWDSASNITPQPYTRNHSKKNNIHELVLQTWGKSSEEAMIAISENKTIHYMSRRAKELTGLNTGDVITPKLLTKMRKTFH